MFGRFWERLGIAEVLGELLAIRGFEFAVERAVFASVLFVSTRLPVTTKPLQRRLGRTRWTGSTSTCAKRLSRIGASASKRNGNLQMRVRMIEGSLSTRREQVLATIAARGLPELVDPCPQPSIDVRHEALTCYLRTLVVAVGLTRRQRNLDRVQVVVRDAR